VSVAAASALDVALSAKSTVTIVNWNFERTFIFSLFNIPFQLISFAFGMALIRYFFALRA
jgi:hypothetical protein